MDLAASVQESTKKIRGIWEQLQSTLKSLQLVVATKAKEDKHVKAASELRVEGHTRVLVSGRDAESADRARGLAL